MSGILHNRMPLSHPVCDEHCISNRRAKKLLACRVARSPNILIDLAALTVQMIAGPLKKNEQISSSFVPAGGQAELNLVKAAGRNWQQNAVRHQQSTWRCLDCDFFDWLTTCSFAIRRMLWPR